jgi:hypothetical protein
MPQPKKEDPDDDEDYTAAMYRRLGLGLAAVISFRVFYYVFKFAKLGQGMAELSMNIFFLRILLYLFKFV